MRIPFIISIKGYLLAVFFLLAGFTNASAQVYRTDPTGEPKECLWVTDDPAKECKWQILDKVNGNDVWVTSDDPPPTNGNNQTSILIEKGYKVTLTEPLDYQNNLTLEVCGELNVSTLILSSMAVSASATIENGNIILTGEYSSKVSLPNDVSRFGFYYLPAESELELLTGGTRLEVIARGEETLEDGYYTASFTYSLSTGELEQRKTYHFVAFVEHPDGNGYSIVYRFTYDGNNNPIVVTEANVSSFKNKLTLIICDDGKLQIESLDVKNGADINVEGSLIVNRIDFKNGMCLTGDGSISTPGGEKPEINDDGTPWNEENRSNCEGEWEGILPIELLSFSYKIVPGQAVLEWETASEINNNYFTIERSRDMNRWEVVGTVAGAGNSNQQLSYQLADYMPLQGLSYYRLKQTDFDGQYEYFKPLAVNNSTEENDFLVSKSPGQWKIILPPDAIWQVEVHSLNGRMLHSGKAENVFHFPAPGQPVVVRVYNNLTPPRSQVVM